MSETYNVTPMKPNGAAPETEAEVEVKIPTAAGADDPMTAVPSSVQALAETMIAQNRVAYERARESMDEAVSMLEVTIERAGEGAIALNRKVIDITQSNLNLGFDLAKELAGADTLSRFMELQVAFMRKQFETMTTQAQEVRELSAEVATSTAAPFKAHVAHSMSAMSVG